MDLQSYQDMIENTLDLEMVTKQNKFLIKGSYNPELQELRDNLDELEDRINRLAEKVAADLGLAEKSVKLESNAQSGYFFRVTRKEDNVFRDNKSYTVIETRKDGIKFQNSKLEKLNEEYVSVLDKYEREQKTVIDDMMKIASKLETKIFCLFQV